MELPVTSENILTAILQWRVLWLNEQKRTAQPPPICRVEPKKLKITYDNYKDYESTFIPLLMHEIWAQIYEEWVKMEYGSNDDGSPMDLDEPMPATTSNSMKTFSRSKARYNKGPSPRQFWIGVAEYRVEGQSQCALKCQYLIESNRLNGHLKLIGDGDLVRLDLQVVNELQNSSKSSKRDCPILSLFGYITNISNERITHCTTLAECFPVRPANDYHVINYQVVIARRQLRLDFSSQMKITGLYYLKPMIRQVEAVANLSESVLADDILSPKKNTCTFSIPTTISIKSPYYNDMQYKAIIGSNEALVGDTPKIQLIQGPPGTGKTHTLIGIIKHFYTNWQDTSSLPKILICAPSNGAIDEVARRLDEQRHFLEKTPARRVLNVLRFGNQDQISESVRMFSLDSLVENNSKLFRKEVILELKDRQRQIQMRLVELNEELEELSVEQDISKINDEKRELLEESDHIKNEGQEYVDWQVSKAGKRHIRYELVKNADVILTTLNSCQKQPLFKKNNPNITFHCVIVDEASQCSEPELLMSLCFKTSKIILIGDPMQLPATVISRYAQEFDFGRSLFERFFIHFGGYNPTSPVIMLREQYRMHPDICHFPSKQFYDNRLLSSRCSHCSELPCAKHFFESKCFHEHDEEDDQELSFDDDFDDDLLDTK